MRTNLRTPGRVRRRGTGGVSLPNGPKPSFGGMEEGAGWSRPTRDPSSRCSQNNNWNNLVQSYNNHKGRGAGTHKSQNRCIAMGGHIGRVHMKVAPSYAERGHGPGREAHPGGHDSSRADRRSSTSFGRTTALARADRRAPTNAHSHAQDPECHDNHHYAENQRCKIPRRNDTLSIKPEEIESDVD